MAPFVTSSAGGEETVGGWEETNKAWRKLGSNSGASLRFRLLLVAPLWLESIVVLVFVMNRSLVAWWMRMSGYGRLVLLVAQGLE